MTLQSLYFFHGRRLSPVVRSSRYSTLLCCRCFLRRGMGPPGERAVS